MSFIDRSNLLSKASPMFLNDIAKVFFDHNRECLPILLPSIVHARDFHLLKKRCNFLCYFAVSLNTCFYMTLHVIPPSSDPSFRPNIFFSLSCGEISETLAFRLNNMMIYLLRLSACIPNALDHLIACKIRSRCLSSEFVTWWSYGVSFRLFEHHQTRQ